MDMIQFEEITDDEERVPIVGIYCHPGGGISYETSLPGPPDLLFVLEQVKKDILENDLG